MIIRRASGRRAVAGKLSYIKTRMAGEKDPVVWEAFLSRAEELLFNGVFTMFMATTPRAERLQRREEHLLHAGATPLDGMLPWLFREIRDLYVRYPTVAEHRRMKTLLGQNLLPLRDWYLATRPSIMSYTFEEAHATQEAWHGRMAEARRIAGAIEGAEMLHRWADGWTLQNLTDRQMLIDEGEIMGHCVGSAPRYWDGVRRGDLKIWSLRDAKNVAHVTVEIARYTYTWGTKAATWRVIQVQGTANTPPKPEYLDRLLDAPAMAEVALTSCWLLNAHKQLRDAARQLQGSTGARVKYDKLEITRKKDKIKVSWTAKYTENDGLMGSFDHGSTEDRSLAAQTIDRLLMNWGWGEAHWQDDSADDDDYYRAVPDDDDEDDERVSYWAQRAAQAALREWTYKPFGYVGFTLDHLVFTRIFPVPEPDTEAAWKALLPQLQPKMHPALFNRLNRLGKALQDWKPKHRWTLPNGEPHDKMLHPVSRALRARARELLKTIYIR